MARESDHGPVLNSQQARQGKELGVMRWVLHISLGLCVLAGVILWIVYG